MKRIYQIALTLIPGIGDIRAKHLLEVFPDVEELFKESKQGLKHIFGRNVSAIECIHNKEIINKAEKELTFIDKNQIQVLFYNDSKYPSRLKRADCPDSPVVLYYKGNADLNASKVISIVGTRNATEYGKEMTDKFVRDLSSENILIVSGLAYGIDIQAHKAALQNHLPTVAVLAHGLDRIYPALHEKTAKQMIENGGLLTDYMSGTKPDAGNFPSRNRIIAGLADATIVMEAGKRGGALITGEIANSYNRDVFAIPGDLQKPTSEGCNHLIKTNKAVLTQSVEDIYYYLGWDKKKTSKPVQQDLFPALTENETVVYRYLLENKECSIDELLANTELSLPKIAAALLNMELQNIVKCLPGKRYKIH